jgi:Phosphotransferase system cellobiose-specific component IIB
VVAKIFINQPFAPHSANNELQRGYWHEIICIVNILFSKGGEKMSIIKALLCCGAGMSSGLMAQKMRKAAKAAGYPAMIEAIPRSGLVDVVGKFDVVLVAPHYLGEMDKLKAICDPHGVPICVIPAEVFGGLDGEAALKVALAAIKGKSKE